MTSRSSGPLGDLPYSRGDTSLTLTTLDTFTEQLMDENNRPKRNSVPPERNQRRSGLRRGKNESAWFTLSASTVSELSSLQWKKDNNAVAEKYLSKEKAVNERDKNYSIVPAKELEQTGNATQKSRLSSIRRISETEQEASKMESALVRKLENSRSNYNEEILESKAEQEAREIEAALIRKLENFRSNYDKERLESKTEQKARKIEAALVRKLGFFRSNYNKESIEDLKKPIHRYLENSMNENSQENTPSRTVTDIPSLFIRKDDDKDDGGSLISSMTREEIEAREMAKKLERKLQSMSFLQSGAVTDQNIRGHLKIDGSPKDEVDAHGKAKSTDSTEILSFNERDDSESYIQYLETNDQITIDGEQDDPACDGDSNKEESSRAFHRKLDEIETSLTILIDQNDEVHTNFLTDDSHLLSLKPENKNLSGTYRSPKSESDRYHEEGDPVVNSHQKTTNSVQECPTEEKYSKAIMHDSVVERALKRHKVAVAEGASDTESNLLLSLREVKEEEGNSIPTESIEDEFIPKEISFSNNSDNSKKDRAKKSSKMKFKPTDGIESNDAKSSEKNITELQSFSGAAPVAIGNKLSSIENRSALKSLRRDESTPLQNNDFLPEKLVEKKSVRFSLGAPLDLENGLPYHNEREDSEEAYEDDDDSAIQRSKMLAEVAKREERTAKRTMVVAIIIMSVAAFIIGFVILDPLRRLAKS